MEESWTLIADLLEHSDEDIRFEATASVGMLAPLDQADEILERIATRRRDERTTEAMAIAAQALEERRLEEAGDIDGWRMDEVRDEIDRLTDMGSDGTPPAA
jgi:hypothetical protein